MNLLGDRLDDSLHLQQLPIIPGYELLNQIGAGGMGVVYRARHIELDRIVAIKVLTRESMLDRESHERFHREATAVAKVQHPNIIQVFDVGTYPVRDGSVVRQPYLSLEYVGGGSLVRQTRNPQPLKQVAKLMESIARAVHAAHEQGVIHRDLKPGNVLLTPDGIPKIADFGLAKSMDTFQENDGEALTQVGVLIGTPEYMSPEQVQGQDNRPSVDIYALGVILYELLTARVPFKGETPVETLILLQSQEPLSPKKLTPNLPRDLETICLKCLQKNPLKRYATAEELADDLARWQRGDAIQARPVGVVERVYRWTTRNPMMAGLVGLVLLGTLGSFLALLIAYGIAEHKTKLALVAEAKAAEQLLAQEYELYRASCLAASAGLQLHNITMAKQALDDAPEQLRGWEWDYFSSQLDSSDSVIKGKLNPNVVRRTRGSQYWIFGDHRSEIIVVDLKSQKVLRRETYDSKSILIANDFGRTLYALHKDEGQVEIRKIESGDVMARIDFGKTVIKQMMVSEDDTSLLVLTPADIQYWSLLEGKMLKRYPLAGSDVRVHCSSPDHSITFLSIMEANGKSSGNFLLNSKTMTVVTLAEVQIHIAHSSLNNDGTRLFTTCLHPVLNPTLWDTSTGQQIAKLVGHTNQIHAVAFSPDDNALVTGSLDHSIRVWDGKTGAPRHNIFAHRGRITDLQFSPDGNQFAVSCNDQTLSLWDLQTGEERARLLGHVDAVHHVAFSEDGTHLLSVAGAGDVFRWNIKKLEWDNCLRGHSNYVYSVDHHPTKPLVISSAWDGTVRVWDLKKSETVSIFKTQQEQILNHVRFHPNGRWFMTVGRDIDRQVAMLRLCELESGSILRSWEIGCVNWKDGRGCFSPDGSTFSVGGRRLYSVNVNDAKAPIKTWIDKDVMTADVAYSPDGSLLAAAFDDANFAPALRFWFTKTGKECHIEIPELRNHGYVRLAFHPINNTLYASTEGGKIFVIDYEKQKLVGVIENGVAAYDLVFTPDGSRLAVACSNNLIRLWDPKSLKLITELTGHKDYVHALAFSPNGDVLVSGSGDKTVRIWKSKPTTPSP